MDSTIKTSSERVDLNMISPELRLIADNWPTFVDPDDKTTSAGMHLRCYHCSQSIVRLAHHGIGYTLTLGEISSATLAHLIHGHRYEMNGTQNGSEQAAGE